MDIDLGQDFYINTSNGFTISLKLIHYVSNISMIFNVSLQTINGVNFKLKDATTSSNYNEFGNFGNSALGIYIKTYNDGLIDFIGNSKLFLGSKIHAFNSIDNNLVSDFDPNRKGAPGSMSDFTANNNNKFFLYPYSVMNLFGYQRLWGDWDSHILRVEQYSNIGSQKYYRGASSSASVTEIEYTDYAPCYTHFSIFRNYESAKGAMTADYAYTSGTTNYPLANFVSSIRANVETGNGAMAYNSSMFGNYNYSDCYCFVDVYGLFH